jgi:hypothetical protein
LIRVESFDGILETELNTSVDNNTNSGWSNTIVEGRDTVLLNSLGKAISNTIILLDNSNISTESSSDIDQWVNKSVSDTSSNTTRSDLSHGELLEVSLLVVFWEDSLDGILEHEIASSSRYVSDTVGNISSPERRSTDLRNVTSETISH